MTCAVGYAFNRLYALAFLAGGAEPMLVAPNVGAALLLAAVIASFADASALGRIADASSGAATSMLAALGALLTAVVGFCGGRNLATLLCEPAVSRASCISLEYVNLERAHFGRLDAMREPHRLTATSTLVLMAAVLVWPLVMFLQSASSALNAWLWSATSIVVVVCMMVLGDVWRTDVLLLARCVLLAAPIVASRTAHNSVHWAGILVGLGVLVAGYDACEMASAAHYRRTETLKSVLAAAVRWLGVVVFPLALVWPIGDLVDTLLCNDAQPWLSRIIVLCVQDLIVHAVLQAVYRTLVGHAKMFTVTRLVPAPAVGSAHTPPGTESRRAAPTA